MRTTKYRFHRFRIPMVIATLAILLVATTMQAGAGVSWCRADPIVEIEGNRVQILVGVPAEYTHMVNGPIHTDLKIPSGLAKRVIFTDEGFNGHGERVTWGTLEGAVKLTVKVPINGNLLAVGETVPVEVKIFTPWGNRTIYGVHTGTSITVTL